MDGYTRAVSGQRFDKQVPAATTRRTTIDALLKTGYFCVVREEEL
jgi:hypothetical protein